MSNFLFETFNSFNNVKITGKKEVTYYKDNEFLIQMDYKNNVLWVRYSIIWKIFESKYNINYNQIRDFIKGWIESNTGWSGLTPQATEFATKVQIESNTK